VFPTFKIYSFDPIFVFVIIFVTVISTTVFPTSKIYSLGVKSPANVAGLGPCVCVLILTFINVVALS